jgi:inner membrane protein involved in colicin E2 resistance
VLRLSWIILVLMVFFMFSMGARERIHWMYPPSS